MNTQLFSQISNPVAVTSTSDITPVSSKEFLYIEDDNNIQSNLQSKIFRFKLLSTFLNYKGVMKQNWVNYIIYQIVMYLIYWPWYSFSWFKCILNPLTYGTLLVFFSCIKFWHWQDLSKVQVALNYLRCNKHALELKSF